MEPVNVHGFNPVSKVFSSFNKVYEVSGVNYSFFHGTSEMVLKQ